MSRDMARAKNLVDALVPEKRRQKTCKTYLESLGLKADDVLDRTNREIEIQNHSSDPR